MPLEDNHLTDPSPKESLRLPRLFLSFGYSQYRWLWANNIAASLGRTSEMLALGWLVLIVTDSPFWVGVTSGLRGLAMVCFGLMGGVIVDRLDRRKILMVGQFLGGLVALSVGFLVAIDRIQLWHLLVVAVIQGMSSVVLMPARNALTYDVVGRSSLLNALALNMMAMNIMRIVGSTAVGLLIDLAGIQGVYVLIALSLVTSSVILALMGGSYKPLGANEPPWRNAREGLTYVWNNRPVRSLLFMSMLMEAFAFSHHVMLPVMARDFLKVGGTGYGLLASASGVGALISTVVLAYMGDFRAKSKLVMVAGGGFGLSLIAFAVSPQLPFSFIMAIVVLVLVGSMSIAYDTTMGALIQLLVHNAVRGRVMGLYVLTFGFTSLGGFLAGGIATILSAPVAIGFGGSVVITYIAGRMRSMIRIQEGVVSRSD
jgi:MFS family permease